MIVTLSDLSRFIEASEEVPASRKPYMRSALNRAQALLGNGRADLRVDPQILLRQLDQLAPAMAGMAPPSFANFKSRVREALRCAAPHLAPARSHTKLTGDWAALEGRLQVREQRQLSRFLRFAQGTGRTPDEVDDKVIDQFRGYVEHEALRFDHAKVVRATRRALNLAADTIPEWPQQRLTPPQPTIVPYWLRLDELPASLRGEIADHLQRLAHPDPFLGPSRQGLAASTIHQHRILLITLASPLVATGVPAQELTSIADLVRPDRLEQALRFLHRRAGGRVNDQILQITYRVRRIAAHAGLPEQDLHPARPDRRIRQARVPDRARSDRQEPAPDRVPRRPGLRRPTGDAALPACAGVAADVRPAAGGEPRSRRGRRGAAPDLHHARQQPG